MKNLVYPAIIEQNDDGYSVSFPDLLGCNTCGFDLAEAILMAEDAACGWILGELEDNKQIPKPSDVKNIKLTGKEYISMVVLDMQTYSEKYGRKMVKKNTTIPAFLNTFGESKKLNYSKVLTDALFELYIAQ